MQFRCPICGRKHEVPEERIGRRIKCLECNEIFTTYRGAGAAGKGAAPKDASRNGEALGRSLVEKTLGDPAAALDGAIPGAISGILTGVVVAILYSICKDSATEDSWGTFGTTVGSLMWGFILGFALGTSIGALYGAASRFVKLKPRTSAFLTGTTVGVLVGFLVGGFQWVPWGAAGAAVGAFGAVLCAILFEKAKEPEFVPSPVHLDEDDHEDYDQRLRKRGRQAERRRPTRNVPSPED